MDGLLETLPGHVGVRIGGQCINALMFADDLILVATTANGLQEIINSAATYLATCGLSVNSGKCMTVAMKTVPKQKKSVIDAKTIFRCAGRALKALSRDDDWLYLGVPFTPEGYTTSNPIEPLKMR